jgi:hypothetical protein
MASANGPNTAFPNMGFGVNPSMMPNGPWAGQDLGAMTQFMPNTPMNNMQNPMGMFLNLRRAEMLPFAQLLTHNQECSESIR